MYYRTRCYSRQSSHKLRILRVFRTTPALPAALEAGLLPPIVRLERLSVLYGLRVRDLPINHPVSKALSTTTLPRKVRPRSDDTEIHKPKEMTQLQGIKRRQKQYSGLSKEEATKLLKERTNQAWEIEFTKAKASSRRRVGNYFHRYQWQPNYAFQANCERTISSAYYMLKLSHGYLKDLPKEDR